MSFGEFNDYLGRRFDRFMRCLDQGNDPGAVIEFAKLCTRLRDGGLELPPRAVASFLEAWLDVLWQARRADLMLEAAEFGLREYGEDPEWRFAKGEALFYLARFTESRDLLKELTYEDIDDPMLYFMLACLSERLGKDDEAASLFETAHKLEPENFRVPIPVTRHQALSAYQCALSELPEPLAVHVRPIPVFTQPLPPEELLQAYKPPLDPMIVAALSHEPAFSPPEARTEDHPVIVLYTGNFAKASGDLELLEDELRRGLFVDIGLFMGFDEEELSEMGLG